MCAGNVLYDMCIVTNVDVTGSYSIWYIHVTLLTAIECCSAHVEVYSFLNVL